MANYIKVDRKIVDWEWYKDICTKTAFIHCLLKANWKDGNFKGQIISRGSFVTGRTKFATETGLTEQQVRTAWNKLKSTNEITINSTNKFTIITVNNYDLYQVINQEDNQQITNKQPTNNQQITTIEEYKNINIKESNTKVLPKKSFVAPTVEDVKVYCQERNNNVDAQKFVDFYECKGWMVGKNKMKDWKAAVRNWERMDNTKSKKPQNTKQSFDQRTYDYDELEKQLIANRNNKARKRKEQN